MTLLPAALRQTVTRPRDVPAGTSDELRALAVAVIMIAIHDAIDTCQPGPHWHWRSLRSLSGHQFPTGARAWINDTAHDHQSPGTFGFWCAVLGLDGCAVADGVEKQLAAIAHGAPADRFGIHRHRAGRNR